MIRRLYLLTLCVATVAAFLLYGWKYSQIPGVPTDDPFRVAHDAILEHTPAIVTDQIGRALAETEAVIGDVRWAFLAIFLLFYLQLMLRRREPPANERQAEHRKHQRARAVATQIKVLFAATIVIAPLVLGVELIYRYPSNEISFLGFSISRGEPEAFRRNVYHYGLLLAVAHLLGFVVFTWLLLTLSARRARRRTQPRAAPTPRASSASTQESAAPAPAATPTSSSAPGT